MEGSALLVLAPVWLVLGATALIAGLRAKRHPRWLIIGRWALALLFVPAGAGANAYLLATGADYAGFADASPFAFVTDTWLTVVAPNQGLFIGLLIVFEAVVGVAVLLGGRVTQAALVVMLGFHVALVAFGWGFLTWSLPMVIALGLLLQAQVEADRTSRRRTVLAPPAR